MPTTAWARPRATHSTRIATATQATPGPLLFAWSTATAPGARQTRSLARVYDVAVDIVAVSPLPCRTALHAPDTVRRRLASPSRSPEPP
jgi:hypothetical protein